MTVSPNSDKFSIRRNDLITTIFCPSVLDMAASREFESISQKCLERPDVLYVLDFKNVQVIDPAFSHSAAQFKAALVRNNNFLCTLNCGTLILRQIRGEGLMNVYTPEKSVEGFLKALNIVLGPSKLDVEFINPFIKAAVHTMDVQTHTQVKSGKLYQILDRDPLPTDLASVIEIQTAPFRGTVALCFPEQVLLDIYFNMLNERFTELNDTVKDAAGELLNIITGQAAAGLMDAQKFKKQFPTLIAGNGLKGRHHFRNSIMVMPFFTESGPFHLEISTETQRAWNLRET